MRVTMLAVVLVLGASCSATQRDAAPATPAITEFVIPTRSPAPSVSPTQFTGHYGWLVATASGYEVRREGETTAVATIPLANGAASPDGHRFAGFTTAAPFELRIVDLATPTATARIAAFADDERPGGVAWSADGTGLVYSVARADAGTRGPPIWSALRTVDLTARTPKEVARIDGVVLRPTLWDRLGGDLVAAFVVRGDIATEYVVVRGVQAPERRTLPDKSWHPTVSGDERWIVLASDTEATLRTFQADDPSFIVETHALTDAAVSAVGRPMSGQIGIVLDGQLILWDPSTGLRGTVPSLGVTGVVGFRFDGSAAVVRTTSGLALLDVRTNRVTPIDVLGIGVALP